jgi:hypothetical protein
MVTKKKPTAKKAPPARKPAPAAKKGKASRPAAPPPKRKRADWQAIERDYRTGKFTDQELADKHGNVVSRQAITKMAKVRGWEKDLSAAVRAATKAKLIADAAREKVAEEVAKGCVATTDTVLAVAEVNKQVILAHREDIKATRALTNAMLAELGATTTGREKLAALIELVAKDADATPAQIADARAALAEITRLPNRILSVNRLVQAMGRLQQLERTAFGLDEPEQPPPVDEVGELSDEELNRRIEERLERLNAR